MRKTLFFILLTILSATCRAEEPPTLDISMDCIDGSGAEEKNCKDFKGSAPIKATFHYELKNVEGWKVEKEWRFCHKDGTLDDPYIKNAIDDEPTITFTQGGVDSIALYVTLTKEGKLPITMHRDYWTHENQPLTITTSESTLTFPNAFSPNGDGKNDFYKPKEFKSIIEFHAIIVNRWGQKVYEWNDVSADGWDGKVNGSDAKQGVYFAYIRAKGADGTKYEFTKSINLLRTYDNRNEERTDE